MSLTRYIMKSYPKKVEWTQTFVIDGFFLKKENERA